MSSYARGFTNGLALGAGLMFLLDPRQGGARRAFVRDKSLRAAHEVEDAAKVGARDLSHRIEGAVARALTEQDGNVSGDVLVARVRARLGHVCAYAGAIEVHVKGGGSDGCVELKGDVLAQDRARILSAVSRVRGVDQIDDHLTVHADASDIPALKAEDRGRRVALARVFNPTTRLLVGAGAAAIAVGALVRGRPLAFLLGGASLLAIARTMAHPELGWHTAPGEKRPAPTGSALLRERELTRVDVDEPEVPTVP